MNQVTEFLQGRLQMDTDVHHAFRQHEPVTFQSGMVGDPYLISLNSLEMVDGFGRQFGFTGVQFNAGHEVACEVEGGVDIINLDAWVRPRTNRISPEADKLIREMRERAEEAEGHIVDLNDVVAEHKTVEGIGHALEALALDAMTGGFSAASHKDKAAMSLSLKRVAEITKAMYLIAEE